MSRETHKCEVLVIGSGPGGSVTAWTLAERGRDVLLLEEGLNLRVDSCAPFSVDEMRQKYRAGGLNPALGKPPIPFVEGCCLGGGSEINSGMYHRTPSDVLARWREEFQVRHLEPEQLAPHFEACEEALSVQLNPGAPPCAAIKMKAGADSLGWKSKEVPRWFKYENSLAGKDEGHSGRRQSMTETLIPRALSRGCRLITGARVERLRKSGSRWEVRAQCSGAATSILADAVFVCCGAVQTPALLRRSGIRKNIGNSLALHPTIKVVAVFPEAVNNNPSDVASQQVTEFAPETCMGCSISSLPYLALAMADHPEAKLKLSTDWRRALIYYAMVTGPTTGLVRNVPFSRDPMVHYSLGDRELNALSAALHNLCRLLLAAGASELYPSLAGFPAIRTEDHLGRIPAELPRHLVNLMTIHLFSSCAMGEAQERCATDSFGKVHGCDNLFINDASLLCTAPGVNPQGSIMGIARRNALHFANAL
jgi:choline dehydrogenase-like flavoprotein